MKNINEQSYTNRELYLLIETNQEANLTAHTAILEKVSEFNNSTTKKLDELIIQAKKTNGSVIDLMLWRAYVKGSTWIIPIIVGSVVSAIVALLFKYL